MRGYAGRERGRPARKPCGIGRHVLRYGQPEAAIGLVRFTCKAAGSEGKCSQWVAPAQ